MYIIFWKKALRRPNLDIRPAAYCARCAVNVAAVQSWKNPMKPWGKYGAQYRYCCPRCAAGVTPYYYAALNAIDWALPAPRIGDRTRPLKEKTLKRIQIGLEKFGRQPIMMDYVHTSRNDRHQDMVWSVDRPQRTQLGIHTHALVQPPYLVDLAYTHGHDNRSTSVEDTTPTQTGRQTHALVVPPFLTSLNHSDIDRSRGIEEPMPAVMPQGNPALCVPPFLVSTNYFRDSYGVDKPYPTQTSGNQRQKVKQYGNAVTVIVTTERGHRHRLIKNDQGIAALLEQKL